MSVLDDLYNQIGNLQAEWQRQAERRAAVQTKIYRLEEAKKKVANEKTDAESAREYIKGKIETHEDSWYGSVYDAVKEIHYSGVNVKYNDYYKDVDYILDEICNEITRLENENRNLGFILNGIANSINNLGNEIEKWRN